MALPSFFFFLNAAKNIGKHFFSLHAQLFVLCFEKIGSWDHSFSYLGLFKIQYFLPSFPSIHLEFQFLPPFSLIDDLHLSSHLLPILYLLTLFIYLFILDYVKLCIFIISFHKVNNLVLYYCTLLGLSL